MKELKPMNYLPSSKTSSLALLGSVFLTFGVGHLSAKAAFSPESLYNQFTVFTDQIIAEDMADIYLPLAEVGEPMPANLPTALMLQGFNVDKSNYSEFASIVARYGFAVIVPNRQAFLPFPPFPPPGGPNLIANTQQIPSVLDYTAAQNSDPTSPLFGLLNPSKLALLGHSQGGAVGLSAMANLCLPFLCEGSFSRPEEVVAGAFYGANLRNLMNQFIPINNADIPIALLQGTLDSIALPLNALGTYENIQDPPKSLIAVEAANHYGITNINNPTNPPGSPIPPPREDANLPNIEQSVAIETIARWSALFLRANIQEDRGALNYIYQIGDAQDDNVTVIRQVIPVPETTSSLAIMGFGIFILVGKRFYERSKF
jgi:hypothetical protein